MSLISHALVLPDRDFTAWLAAADAWLRAFERVVVVRSPAGNDLNRYRSVTAVQTAGVWLDNSAVAHIRRIYPMVVRVDVVDVDSPAALRRILDERVAKKDRYGETLSAGRHIDDRFVLAWMCDQRPARIVRRFNTPKDGGKRHEGMDVYALEGAQVRAAVGGTVAVVMRQPNATGYGQYVQVQTNHRGVNYMITYARLNSIAVNMGQIIKTGDPIATAAGGAITVVVQKLKGGLKGYALPDVVDPAPLLYWDGLRLRTTVDGLRLRERPSVDGTAVGQVYLYDDLEPLEPHGRVLNKVGEADQWVRVRPPNRIDGFAAAWYLTAEGTETRTGLNMTGMNLDISHPLGKPAPERLRGLGWVRFAYNVSQGTGSTDFAAADRLYRPYIERYANAGLRPILVLGHQLYGEGRFHWGQMDADRWNALIRDFANACREVARRYNNGAVGAYQIWNEQDTPPHLAHAAVSVPPDVYGRLLNEAIRAIRSVDPTTKIITGGLVSGSGAGPLYMGAALNAMPANVRPDGIAFHAYGLGTPGGVARYSPFGNITPTVRAFSRILNAPVWITEWGILDFMSDPPDEPARYATGFIKALKTYYPDRVAAACWYAWADTMHNGYGLVDRSDRPRQPLYDAYLDL